jgi:hypothetical protein
VVYDVSEQVPNSVKFFTAPILITNMPVQTRRRKAMQDAGGDEDADVTQQSFLESSPAQKLPMREKDEETAVQTKGTLTVFGDDDEEELKAPLEPSSNLTAASTAAKKAEAEEEEEEDSDDEAPEAVSTAKAAEDIKKSAQVAQKAAKEYAFPLSILRFFLS